MRGEKVEKSPESGCAIYWVRSDFRLHDNLALKAASKFENLVCVFQYDQNENRPWTLGSASKWWLYHSLTSFRRQLEEKGSGLWVIEEPLARFIGREKERLKIASVFWNREYLPKEDSTQQELQQQLKSLGVDYQAFRGNLVKDPSDLTKEDGSPYLVYTPFWRNFVKHYQPCMFEPPELPPVPSEFALSPSGNLDDLCLMPKISWDEGFYKWWVPGEQEALRRFEAFLDTSILDYRVNRDQPATQSTSSLSPYLRFGQIHPQRILGRIVEKFGPLAEICDENVTHYCKEVVWREFSYHLLTYFPETVNKPLRRSFEKFPWKNDGGKLLRLWQKGQTGYPIVDAGMRQLWVTGWMHNRVRMITASFLIKDLNITWLQGARWFWDTLVDADLASNTQGWQWTAGCGADAAPYFRVFNPITQGEKFDSAGLYIKQWCPELSKIPVKYIHKPWQAPRDLLEKSGVTLGVDYPLPIVDHQLARKRALDDFANLQQSGK